MHLVSKLDFDKLNDMALMENHCTLWTLCNASFHQLMPIEVCSCSLSVLGKLVSC